MAKIKAKKMRKKKGSRTKFLVVIAIVVLAGIVYAVTSGGPSGSSASSGKVMTLSQARAAIDNEYIQKGWTPTDTGPVVDGYTPIVASRVVNDNLKLPSYAYTNALTLKAYTFATEHPGILEQIACYCGCGSIGHQSLRDCYINNDGTYDDHASFCDTCIGENLKVQKYLDLN